MNRLLTTSVLASLLAAGTAQAGSDDLTFQGRLLDADGVPANGQRDIDVALYHAVSGGPVHHQEAFDDVMVSDGYFALVLSDVPASALVGDVWVGLSIDGADELEPRSPINAVPLALSAQELDAASYGRSASRPAGSCAEVLTVWPAAQTGTYWLTISSGGQAVPVVCDMETEDGGWIDVVATWHQAGADIGELQPLFFAAGATLTTAPGTNTNDVDGIVLTSNQAGSHEQAFYLKPTFAISAVRVSYRMQGSDPSNHCSTGSWIPLNGPGYNGGSTSYLAACPSGYSCIQGTASNGRDASIATSYTTDTLDWTDTLLTWSGSNYQPTSSGCARDNQIPSTSPALWLHELRIR